MRAELETAGVPATAAVRRGRPLAPSEPRRRRRLDWFELALLGAFSAVSVWTLALDVWQVVVHGLVWTGTDGIYVVDQLQYLAWIRDASHHLLVSNLFVLRPTPADYFQPGVAVSGALVALGVAPWLALLVWKPVAVLVAFLGIRAYVGRAVSGPWPRRATLALALFFGSFSVIYGSVGVVGDLFLSFLSWGYTFGLLAVAVMIVALLAYERSRAAARISPWRACVPGTLGALASLLHPWQGELLILVVMGAEIWCWRASRRRPPHPGMLAGCLLATGLPLLYYLILGQVDIDWHLAQVASKHSFSMATVALALAPLVLVGMPAWRRRPGSFLEALTRAWPLAALVIFLVSESGLSATPLHAFDGATVPLAILAVQGMRQMRLSRLRAFPALAAGAVLLSTVPAVVYQLRSASRLVAPSDGNSNFIARDEQRALQYLDHDRTPGGVLTRFYLGSVVPADTGRRTYVGNCLWSEPDCGSRAQIAQMIFDGTLPPDVTRMFVRATGARFLLADCETQPGMDAILAPITAQVKHFGCATVYQLSTSGPGAMALAQSAPDAALRAPGRQQRGVQSG